MPPEAEDFFDEDPGRHTCTNCGKHRASVKWVGEGSTLDLLHGHYTWWCSCCALRAQVAFARKIARRIPRLERELKRKTRRCGGAMEVAPRRAGAGPHTTRSGAPSRNRSSRAAGHRP